MEPGVGTEQGEGPELRLCCWRVLQPGIPAQPLRSLAQGPQALAEGPQLAPLVPDQDQAPRAVPGLPAAPAAHGAAGRVTAPGSLLGRVTAQVLGGCQGLEQVTGGTHQCPQGSEAGWGPGLGVGRCGR